MCEANHASQLVALPFIGLQDQVDDILAQKCRAVVEVAAGIPWHKVLYAWRIQHGDFRGAAAVGWERLGKLRGSPDGERLLTDAGEGGIAETQITRQFVAVINALSCVDAKQAWILCEERGKDKGRRGENADAAAEVKRTVVTLEAIRRGYQEELDRVAAIEMGQFALMGGGAEGDAMDVL
jgi:nuclear pore complex protein Nup160